MKWWFSDYDGTINLNHDDVVAQKDLDFIHEWVNSGNKLVFASGRMNHEIKKALVRNNLEYDYIIANNGAIVYDDKDNVIANLTISKSVRAKLIEKLKLFKGKVALAYCLENRRYDLFPAEKEVNYMPYMKEFWPSKENWDAGVEDILNSDDLNLIYFFIGTDYVDEIKEAFSEIKEIKVLRTGANILELMDAKVSKAHGIKAISDIYKIDLKDIYTSGDGDNDVEMLEYTDNSFAMAKGAKSALNAGKHVINNVCEIKNYIKD